MVQVIQVIQVIRAARTISLDDMHSENIWFSWYKPSKYREKLICHACDGGRTNGRKVENSAVFCWTRNRKSCHKHQDHSKVTNADDVALRRNKQTISRDLFAVRLPFFCTENALDRILIALQRNGKSYHRQDT